MGTVGPGPVGEQFWVELLPNGGPDVCDGCGQTCQQVHDTTDYTYSVSDFLSSSPLRETHMRLTVAKDNCAVAPVYSPAVNARVARP